MEIFEAHILSSQERGLPSRTTEIELPQPAVEPDADPEFEILLASCRGANMGSSFPSQLPRSLNWDRVLRLAEYHRLLSPLFHSTQARNNVPTSVQSELRARFQTHARQALRLSAELIGILRKFKSCGIEALSHKGPVLAQMLFGDPAMRQFGDLDLLVQPSDISRARSALQDLGYLPKLQLSERQERAYLRSGYEHAFGSDRGANLLELQWQILPRFYSIPFAMDSLFLRSVEIDFEGTGTRVLHNDDLLLVLCVHAAKHGWSELGMLRDIATLARFDLNWDRIEHEAQRLGILRILTISLLLVRDLLQCELAVNLESSWELAASGRLAGIFQSALRCKKANDFQALPYLRTMMRVRERRQDRLKCAFRLLITPGIGEWQNVAIPDPLFPLYRGVRAIRFMRRVFSPGATNTTAETHLGRAI